MFPSISSSHRTGRPRPRRSRTVVPVVATLAVLWSLIGGASAVAAPFPDTGSSGSSDQAAPIVGSATVFRELQWIVTGGRYGALYKIRIDPEDTPYRDCVDERTEGFNFELYAPPNVTASGRHDTLSMVANQTWNPFGTNCADRPSKQAWTITIEAKSNEQYLYTKHWLVKYEYQSGRLVVSEFGVEDLLTESGADLDVRPPVPGPL